MIFPSQTNKVRVCSIALSPLVALICLTPLVTRAQSLASSEATPAAKPASAPPPTATPQAAAPGKPVQIPEGAMLDADPRLKQKVTLTLDNVTLSKALVQISVKTRLSLLAEGEQLQTKKISASFTDKPLRDVLDALASLGRFEWVGRKSGAIVLRAVPVPGVKPELEKYGLAIKSFVDKMTPEQKEALAQPYATAFSDVPPAMQSAILGALSTMHDPAGQDGQPIPFFEEMMNNQQRLVVGFQVNHQEDGNDYYLSCGLPGHSSGVWLVDHE